ncbi:hypothetical protein X777_15438 [Ooceraea biroi]|uniref:Uncharacterized protein n=1 Tax=Ooceraea biroi TaxID=2015173 RepID=A0A026VVL3_OOCBI|nr:hypothetical protein X777_15438 [Ooceraea biroi]
MKVSKTELYEIVFTVTRILMQRSPHLSRMCNVTWRSRLQSLSRNGLLRKLQFLINHSDLRTIVKCFNRRLFANDPDILCILYNEIVRRGLQDAVYVENISRTYMKLSGNVPLNFY